MEGWSDAFNVEMVLGLHGLRLRRCTQSPSHFLCDLKLAPDWKNQSCFWLGLPLALFEVVQKGELSTALYFIRSGAELLGNGCGMTGRPLRRQRWATST